MTITDPKETAEERAHGAGCPVVDFDIERDPAFVNDLWAQWRRARDLGPVFYSTAATGFWVLAGRDEIHEALSDSGSFSARMLMAYSHRPRTEDHFIPMTLDPPEHARYRALLSPLLGPRATAAQEPKMREVANTLIDDILAEGTTCDFMRSFAYRLPGQFFGGWLGFTGESAAEYTQLATAQVHYDPGSDPTGERWRVIQERTNAVMMEVISARRADPGDDIISELLAAELDGRPLTDDELVNITTLLFLAGFDTTAGAFGEIIAHLARHPGQREAARNDGSALERIIEECLRFYAISGSSGRLVVRDTVVGGCPMKAGDKVFSALQAANRDSRIFDRPDEFVPDRWPNRHVGFGLGIHRCLGSHVARAELMTSVAEWLRRIPDFEIEEGAALTHEVSVTTVFTTLPLRLYPAGTR